MTEEACSHQARWDAKKERMEQGVNVTFKGMPPIT
jgi:hypothetical protein